MDIKTHMLRLQRSIQENPAKLALAVIAVIAVAFISAMFLDSYLKERKRQKHRRGKTKAPPPPVH